MNIKKVLTLICLSFFGLFILTSCGKTATTTEHTHEYESTYSKNEEGHWYQAICEHTDEKKDFAAHTYGDFIVVKEATEDEAGSKKQVCSVCGYENIVSIPSLNHDFASEWKYDEENHWHECICGEKDALTKHTYGETTVITEPTHTSGGTGKQVCSVCGYENTVTIPAIEHNYTMKYDEDNHWLECECGDKKDEAAHNYENGCCKDCGYRYTSEGLAFNLSDDGTYYIVCNNDCNDEFINIPSEYKGLPVGAIGEMLGDGYKGVFIPNTVKYIDDYAFSERENLEIVIFEDNSTLEYIGYDAFEYCVSLKTISIPKSVKTINDAAFMACDNLESVVFDDDILIEVFSGRLFYDCCNLVSINIPKSVKVIENYSFVNTGFTQITIPEGITSIGEYAFYSCLSLRSVVIPKSLNQIGENAFFDCSKLESVAFDDEIILETLNIGLFGYCTSLKTITIPQSVKIIDEAVFYENSSLNAITIPSGVTSIGASAFYNCTRLTNITIPKSVSSIGIDAFGDCHNLESVTFEQDSVITEISDNLFINCFKLTSINLPAGITTIGQGAFSNTALYSIVIPSGVTAISISAFEGCNSLFEVYNLSDLTITVGSTDNGYVGYYAKVIHKDINDASIYTTIDDYLFVVIEEQYTLLKYCGNERNLVLPIIDGVTYKIGNCAFQYSNILSVVISEGVTEIGVGAFSYCSDLLRVTLSNTVAVINDEAFMDGFPYEIYNYSSLTLTIGSTDYGYIARYAYAIHTEDEPSIIEVYDDYLFVKNKDVYELVGYTGVETEIVLPETINGEGYMISRVSSNPDVLSVVIPDTVFYIENRAFNNLTAVEKIEIHANIQTIFDGMFDCCENLKEIYIPKSVTHINQGAFHGCEYLEKVIFEEGSNLTFIGNGAFGNCISLEEIILPESVEEIAINCFSGSGIKSFIIPANVTKIANQTFAFCNNLSEVIIGSNVTIIEYGAFQSCESLLTVIFDGDSSLKTIKSNAFVGSGIISITIPSSVKIVEQRAFLGCSSLEKLDFEDGCSITSLYMVLDNSNNNIKEIKIPKNVVELEDNIFAYFKNLEKVVFEDGSKLEKISQYAFQGTGIKEFIIPKGLKSIGNYAFSYCNNLASVSYEDGAIIETIDEHAFYYCDKLSSINLPDCITTINKNAFYGCNSLQQFTVPKSVTIISFGMFNHCTSLEKVIMHENITVIDHNAFSSCSNLKELVIPSNLTTIGDYAFNGCSGLTEIVIPSSVTTVGIQSFNNCANLTIYCESTELPSGWNSNWNSSSCPVYWYSETEPIGEGNYWHYVDGVITKWE